MGERVKRSDVGPTIKRNTGVHRRTWRKPTANRSPTFFFFQAPKGMSGETREGSAAGWGAPEALLVSGD